MKQIIVETMSHSQSLPTIHIWFTVVGICVQMQVSEQNSLRHNQHEKMNREDKSRKSCKTFRQTLIICRVNMKNALLSIEKKEVENKQTSIALLSCSVW